MRTHLLNLLPLCLMLAACGGSKTSSSTAQTGAAATAGTVTCSTDSRVTPYTAGMTMAGTSGNYTFAITAMQPAPPATGTGTMSLKITDKSGAPVTDATVSLALFMPDHGHGSSITPQVAVADGGYNITNVYLFMPGVWRMTFTAASADKSVTDTGVVLFCVPG